MQTHSSRTTHEPCPRCREQGKDTKGDNLARWPNGSAYCFSCGHKEWPKNYIPLKEKDVEPLPTDLTTHFHEDNLRWLRKYITDGEIMDHFKYSPSLKRHVYKYADYWEARSVNPTVKRKCISHGVKPYNLMGKGDTIVVVEDIVSAIKVSRVAKAFCLFGSHLPPDVMVKLVKERPKEIVVWLDEDKYLTSMKFVAMLNKLAPIARLLHTPFDPKDYSIEEIKSFLEVKP